MQTDEELAAAASGDEDAFRALVERYEKRIYSITLRFTAVPEDAFDLTQEVFIKAWKGLAHFRGEAAFSTWLYRLARNVCADHARRNKNKRTVSLDDREGEPLWELSDERYDPARWQEKRQLREDIEAALTRLNPEFRAVLLLRELSGLSYAEIAAALAVEEGTVKSRLSRARLRLRAELQNMWNETGKHTSKDKKR